ncbi:MAG: MFS transporter [Actinomycetota bacterium]|nr:MFS transporter [Actinomycetota bacterium]
MAVADGLVPSATMEPMRLPRPFRRSDAGGSRVIQFAWAHGLAAAGDAMVTVSLAGSLFFSVSPDASRRQVLIYLGAAMVPFILIAPLVGPAIDRFRYSHRWIAASFFVVRAIAAVALAFFLYDLFFYFFALLALVLNRASGVVRQAIVPALVDRSATLVSANSYLARVATIAGAVGGGAGTAVLVATDNWAALVGAAVLFLAAAAAVSRVPAPEHKDEGSLDLIEYQELHTPGIQAASNALAVLRAAVGYFVFGLAFALRRDSEPAWMYGVSVVLYGVGVFLANSLAPALRRRRPEPQLITGSLIALFVCAGFAALGTSRPIILLVAGILGLSAGIGRQSFDSLLQRRAPLAVRGRSFARFETRFQLAWAAGVGLATALAVSIQISMAVIALTLAPTVVLYFRSTVEEHRFGELPGVDSVAIARRHLALAVSLFDAHKLAQAATEISAGVDALLVEGRVLHPSISARASDLRTAALRGGDDAVMEDDLRSVLKDLSSVLTIVPQQHEQQKPPTEHSRSDSTTSRS